MAAGFALAEAFVRIRPTTDGFRAEADAGIKAALAGENPRVVIEAETKAAKVAAMDLRDYINVLASRVKAFRLVADDKAMQATLASAAIELGKLGKMVAKPKIGLEGATKVQASVLTIDALMDKVSRKLSVAHVALDDGNTQGRLAMLEVQLTALTSKAREIKLGISDPAGLMVLDELQRRINDLHSKVLSVGFLETAGNAGEAMRQILMLKRLMQTAGLADFLDINMKPSQIMGQLILLRQRIASANLNDALALNMDTSGVMEQIKTLRDLLHTLPQNESIGLSAASLGEVEQQVNALSMSLGDLAVTEAKATVGSARFTGGWAGWVRMLGTAIPVFDGMLPGILASIGAWHLLVDVAFEFLAVLIPATIGIIAFGAAAVPTIQDIVKQMGNINTVTQATGKSLYPLTGQFQKIADAVQPQVYQLFGDALTVMNSRAGEFKRLATGAGQALTQLAARATSALLSGGFSQFLKKAEADIMGLGTVVGNIFGTIGNLLKTLPGYANYILNFFVTVTHGLEVFTGTGIFSGIAKAGLALHGAFVYAGLGFTAFAFVGRKALTVVGDLLERAAIPLAGLGDGAAVVSGKLMGLSKGLAFGAANFGWIALAAAAVVIFGYAVTRTSDETGTWIGQLNQWVQMAPAGVTGAQRLASAQTNIAIALQGVNVNANKAARPVSYLTGAFRSLGGILASLLPGLGSLDGSLEHTAPKLSAVQQQMNTVHWSTWALGIAHSNTALGGLAQDLQTAAQAFGLARTPAQELLKEQQVLTDQAQLYGGRLTKVAVLMGGVSNAQTILTASGVTMKQMLDGSKTAWMQILQQVDATLAAYKAMGQRAGILGADLNALNLAGSDQVTQMGNLNAAWDKVIGIISGGQTSFITFQQDMISVSQSLAQAGGSARIVTNTFPATATAIAAAAQKSHASMTGLNAASLQLRQTWQTAFTGGSSLIDALRMMTSINPGAQSGSFPQLTRVMKDTLLELVPLGKTSKATRAEMVSLAQEVNPAITNFHQLTIWLGNTKNPAKDLQKVLASLGVSIQNLANDASTLYATLQTDLLKQFDEAKLKASNVGQALTNFAKDVENVGTSAKKIHGDEATLAADMLKSGLNAKDAGAQILSMGGHISVAGLNASQKHQALVTLYEDFRKAGVGANAAATLVSILTSTLFKVPNNIPITVTAHANADGSVSFTEKGIPAFIKGGKGYLEFHAAGGLAGSQYGMQQVMGSGFRDTVPAMLTPGETVVPRHLTPLVAPLMAAHRVPGFAYGGSVGGYAQGGLVNPGAFQQGLLNIANDVVTTVGTVSGETQGAVSRVTSAVVKEAIKEARAAWLAGMGGGSIVADAMHWLGKIPYVWGGTAVPGGADCSGFVQTIYGRHGIAAPRTSEAQMAWAKSSPPVPGGLAFYISSAGGPPPGHVAIVGDGGNVISQGGGMGPQLHRLNFGLPLMGTGVPPGGFPGGATGPMGGHFSLGQLEQLWMGAGGPGGFTAHVAGAIALAESGGVASITNSIGAAGLWQIFGLPFPGNPLIPSVNAAMAVTKWRDAQGFGPWVTYVDGAYRAFMAKGGRVGKGKHHHRTPLDERISHVMRYMHTHPDEPVRYTELQEQLGTLMPEIGADRAALRGRPGHHLHGRALRHAVRDLAADVAQEKHIGRELAPLIGTRGWVRSVIGGIQARDKAHRYMHGDDRRIARMNEWLNKLEPSLPGKSALARETARVDPAIAGALAALNNRIIPSAGVNPGGPIIMDHGGWVMPGMNHIWNGTGVPERVTPRNEPQQLILQLKPAANPTAYDKFLHSEITRLVRNSGGGNVQLAFGSS